MVRNAIGAALAMCLASACLQGSSSLSEPDPGEQPGEDPGLEPGDDPSGAAEPGQGSPPATTEPADEGAAGDPSASPEEDTGEAPEAGLLCGPTLSGATRGGQPHQAALTGRAAATDPAALLHAVEGDLNGRVGPLVARDFQIRRQVVSTTGGGAPLRHVDMIQRIGSVPIHGSYLQLTVREDAVPRVVGSSYRLFRNPAVDTAPSVTQASAARLARKGLRVETTRPIAGQELQVRELDGVLELVWAIAVRGSHARALVIASGRRAGAVVPVDERVYETAGHVSGFIATAGAPGGLGTVASTAIANLDLTAPSASTTANAVGEFWLDVPRSETISARLRGRAAHVIDMAGEPVEASGPAAPTLDLVMGSRSGGEEELSQVTAYVAVDQSRTFVEANGVASELLGGPLTTNINVPGSCNAFYSQTDRSINFFASGSGCNSSATESVVSHEYGHFVDDAMGGITDVALSEGWGDLLSCFRLGNSAIGFDLFPGEKLRDCNNDYVYPPGGVDEAHALGQAWAGFGWRVRQGLITALGARAGDALARSLILPSLASNAADIPSAVREVFLRDDDDGDLSNHTPHWNILYAAALHHGLTRAIETDALAPSAVTDLTAVPSGATGVSLSWTAPGDDLASGTAAAYEVRFSNRPITAQNFTAAQLAVGPPAPGPAGTEETMTVIAPPATTLYFALVARDEQENASSLSNVITATTGEGVAIYQEGAEDGLNGYAATGLWHPTTRRASEGVRSFWYGREDTGNYDTGEANAGTLTSPIIDLREAEDPILTFEQFVEVEEGENFDRISVTVTNADDPTDTMTFGKDTATTGGAFVPRILPLGAFAGQRIRLTFAFDTVDPVFNTGEGWFVDDIRILVTTRECAHDVCEPGEALDPGCSMCATSVCEEDPFCCEVFWDRICVREAEDMCGEACGCDRSPHPIASERGRP